MTAKVLYFIAGVAPTVGEAADIASLEAVARPYDIQIRSLIGSPLYGDKIEASDFVAGTVPDEYEEVDVLDPDALPEIGVEANQIVLTDGDDLDITAGNVVFDVTDSVLTGVLTTDATHKVVAHGDVLNAVGGGTIAVSIVAGVATYTYTAP